MPNSVCAPACWSYKLSFAPASQKPHLPCFRTRYALLLAREAADRDVEPLPWTPAGGGETALSPTSLLRSPLKRCGLLDIDDGAQAFDPFSPLLAWSPQPGTFPTPSSTGRPMAIAPPALSAASQGALLVLDPPQRDIPRSASASPEVTAASPLMLLPSPAASHGSRLMTPDPPRAAFLGAALTPEGIPAGKPVLRFYTPRGAHGAFALMRLNKDDAGAAAPPRPLLFMSPGVPSPGALLAAELLLEFAAQPCRSIGTPAPPRREADELLMLTPPAGPTTGAVSPVSPTGSSTAGQPASPGCAAGSPALTTRPATAAVSPAAGVHPALPAAASSAERAKRAVVSALKTPLRSALKKRPLPLGSNTPEPQTAPRSSKRVRFLKAPHTSAGSPLGSSQSAADGQRSPRRGFLASPWRPSLSLFLTPGRAANVNDPRSPLAGESPVL